jgi:hypothetical protein
MEHGNHHYQNVMVVFFLVLHLMFSSSSSLAKCRLPDLGRNLIGFYMDDINNELYGKELQPGAYIRHGYSIKYQCQCQLKSIQNCSIIKPLFIQCIDGQWTNGGPQCRNGI